MLHSHPPFFNHKDPNTKFKNSLEEENNMEIQDAPLNLTCRKLSSDISFPEKPTNVNEVCASYAANTIGTWSIVQTPLLLPGMKSPSWNCYPWSNYPLLQMREQSLQYQQAYWQLINHLLRNRTSGTCIKEEAATLQSEIEINHNINNSKLPAFARSPSDDIQSRFPFGSSSCEKGTNFQESEVASPKHLNVKQRTRRNSSATKCSFKCSQCGVTYPHRFELNRHIKVSHVRPHRCDHCGKGFGHKNYLQVHIETVHLGRKIHKCDLCGKYLSTGGNLSVHIRTIHMGEKKYKCSVCSRTFGQQCNMKTHMKRHFFKQSEQKCATTSGHC